MRKLISLINRNQFLMVLLGSVILGWGIYGIVNIVQQISAASAQASSDPLVEDLGFAPYLVPVGTEMAPENDQLLAGTATPEGFPTGTVEPRSTLASSSPKETPTPSGPYIPDRIVIPAIDLDAPVVEALVKKVKVDGVEMEQWLAPDELAAGWHTTSAPLGEVGNTVLNGHHNMAGEVFRHLVDLKVSDRIIVYSGNTPFQFEVTNIMILPERGATLEQRLSNARWINPSHDVRLTLVTCWPYESNTHRLIIVARPLNLESEENQ